MNSSDACVRDGDLLTRFSILILAGIFLAMRDIMVPVDMRTFGFLVGVAGLLCYAGLELVACRKIQAGSVLRADENSCSPLAATIPA